MENKDALQTVKDIREMMEKSSKFLSFSGLSSVLVGVYALLGAWRAFLLLQSSLVVEEPRSYLIAKLVVLAKMILGASLITVLVLSWLKSKKTHATFFSQVTYRTFFHFFLPLSVGGMFCIALIVSHNYVVIAPVMLLFYGVSLVNVSKFAHKSLLVLGCVEMILGIVSAFLPGQGLWFWTIGFGIIHIIYGVYFYFVVERKSEK